MWYTILMRPQVRSRDDIDRMALAKAYGLTLQQISQIHGCGLSSVSRYLKGVSLPAVEPFSTEMRIAAYLIGQGGSVLDAAERSGLPTYVVESKMDYGIVPTTRVKYCREPVTEKECLEYFSKVPVSIPPILSLDYFKPDPNQQSCCLTYFVEAPTEGLLKIGQSWDVEKRLRNLKYSSPVPLVLLGTSLEDEKQLHKRFAHLRKHGEWFEFTDELKDFVDGFSDNPYGVNSPLPYSIAAHS